ncbi:LysR family transcriptional regulator (plasmid) [Skermanella mucosa]|uniref:LysR family transcriptional regulator n=1 Tax=Skermanella mucosa TaxID=1789672 RepID=UPI00192C9C70|nr:LysR family transcriptional regulator [Skermanella mucosa]UEM24724.1 LysR family transcriptional regulator [Skermanella mucosa]
MKNNVTLRQLEAFLAIAATGSFHEAAEQVGLSQPAVSLSIQRLEEAVGARLLDRTTRTVSLSPEGREFEQVARTLVNDWAAAFSGIHDLITKRRGRVAVATLPSVAASLLPRAVAGFSTEYPGIDVVVRDVLADEVLDLVKSGKADLGISVDPGETEGLSFEPLLTDRFVALLPGGHGLLEQPRLDWADLAAYPVIAMSRTTSVRQHLDRLQGHGVRRLDFRYEVDHLATVAGMVAAGLGVSALPSLCLPVVLRGGLAWRPLGGPVVDRRMGVIRRARSSLSVAAGAFGQAVRTAMADPAGLGPGHPEMTIHEIGS